MFVSLHLISITDFLFSVSFQEGEPSEVRAVTKVLQTQRELRFLSFASVEYEGNVYMTPQDFLESVMEEVPRREYPKNYYLTFLNLLTLSP